MNSGDSSTSRAQPTIRSRARALVDGFSLATPWPAGGTRWFVLVAVVGFIAQMLPRRIGWTGHYLFAEDGQVFLTQTLAGGIGSLFDNYAGYLHVVPRLISISCAQLGPDVYVACTNVAVGGVKVAGMAIAFPVLAAYAASWRWGLAAASAFVFIPVGQQEVLGNLTNLRWFLVAAAFFAVLGVFRSRGLAIFATIITLLAALSDPMPAAFAPIAIWRIWAAPNGTGRGWSRLPSIGLLAGAAIHLLRVDPAGRDFAARGDFWDLVEVPSQGIAQLLIRGPVVTQIGMTWTQDLMRHGVFVTVAVLVIPLVLIVLAWRTRRYPDPALRLALLLTVVGTVLLVVVLSFPASYIALPGIWDPSQPSRYSAFAALFLTPALVLVMARTWHSTRDPRLARVWTVLVAAVLAFGYLGDAGGDARHSSGTPWSETVALAREQCAAGVDAPTVPNVPEYEGWMTTLQCEWLR